MMKPAYVVVIGLLVAVVWLGGCQDAGVAAGDAGDTTATGGPEAGPGAGQVPVANPDDLPGGVGGSGLPEAGDLGSNGGEAESSSGGADSTQPGDVDQATNGTPAAEDTGTNGASGDDGDEPDEQPAPSAEPSDFEPATGADTSAEAPSGYGPWNVRLRVATSVDGLTWTRTEVTVTDQGDVPCVLLVDGKLWLFYVIWNDIEGSMELRNTTVAAYTTDLVNWTFKKLNFGGSFPSDYTRNPVDPTVVAMAGGYRMYFTLGPLNSSGGARPHTFTATSTDLINWTFEGERYEVSGEEVLDPNLLWVGDHYEFFAGGVPGGNHHATSTDGLSFTAQSDFTLTTPEGGSVVLSNGALIGQTYRYYAFAGQHDDPLTTDIRSLTYGSGTWSLESGVRLAVDTSEAEESVFVKDAAVGPHPDGESHGYVMVYVTVIP